MYRSTLRPSSRPKIPVARDEMKAAVLEALRDLVAEGRTPQQVDIAPASSRTSIPPPPMPPTRIRREVPRELPQPAPREQTSFTRHAMQALTDAELTPQEIRIALLVLQGLTNEQISQEAELSQKTIKHHIGSIFRKFHVDSRAQLSARIFPIG